MYCSDEEDRQRMVYYTLKGDQKMIYPKNILGGLAFIVLGLLSIWTCDMDATFAVLAVPFGFWMIFSKDYIFDERSYWDDESCATQGSREANSYES